MDIHGFIAQLTLKPGDILAIDGRCGAGKTTLARTIAQRFDVDVVHMDDFFLPPNLRTPQRLSQPGCNVHYERILSQVLQPYSQGQPITYAPFDCHSCTYQPSITLTGHRPLVLEGSYSLRPDLRPYYTQTVFLTIDSATQQQRIATRNGQEGLATFLSRWIPPEEAYFAHYAIAQQAQFVIEG